MHLWDFNHLMIMQVVIVYRTWTMSDIKNFLPIWSENTPFLVQISPRIKWSIFSSFSKSEFLRLFLPKIAKSKRTRNWVMRSHWKRSRLQKQTTAYFSVTELIRGLKAYAVKIDEAFSAGNLFLKRHLNGLSVGILMNSYRYLPPI